VLLDPAGQGEDLPQHGRVLDLHQHRRLPVAEPAVAGRLVQDGADQGGVAGLGAGLGQGRQDLFMVDEVAGRR